MNNLVFEEKILEFSLSEYVYALGIGVKSSFYYEGEKIGIILFLCDKSDTRYEFVSLKSHEEIQVKLKAGIMKGVFNENIKSMFHWQAEIGKLGHNYSSPIYGQLANVF